MKVIKDFICKDTAKFHRAGSQYDGDRLEELQSKGYVVVSEEEQTEWPKHVGGGHYELSNGDKIKGKDDAFAAQAEIDAAGD